MSHRIELSQLRVAMPCTQPWNEMAGDARRRHCTHCDRHVHNLSELTSDEAQRLLCSGAGRLCVAYFPNADGSPQTLEYRPRPQRHRFGWTFATLLGGLGALAAAVVQHTVASRPAPPVAGIVFGGAPALDSPMIMGDIGPPATRPVDPAVVAPSGEAATPQLSG